MSLRLIFVSAVSVATLAACATRQENPIYKYSSTYKTDAPQTAVANSETTTQIVPVIYDHSASTDAFVVPASSTVQATRIVNECRMTNGLETCRAVEIPVSAIQTETAQPIASQTYTQDAYLIEASSEATAADGRLTQVEGDCIQAGAVVPCYPVEIPITTQATISEPYFAQPEIIMAGSGQGQTSALAPTDTQYAGELAGTPGYYAVQNTQDYVASETIDLAPTSPKTVIAAAAGDNSQFADNFIVSDGAMLHNVTEGDTLYSLARKTCTSVAEIQSLNSIGADFGIRLGDNIRLPASRC